MTTARESRPAALRPSRFVAFALLCASLLLAVPAFAAIQAKPLEWRQGKQRFSGFIVYNDSTNTPRPGLVMVPDWMGVTPASVEKAKQIANAGYVVLVADVYGRGVRPKDAKAAGAQAQKMYADLPALRARAALAVETLRAQAGKTAPVDPTRIGALGYCFGGKTVLELARSGADIAGVVSYHGGLDTTLPAKPGEVKASVLVLNGAADTYVPADHIAGLQSEMTAAGVDWQFVNYADAVHCFALETANSPGCMYNERAAKRAFSLMNLFFHERFGR